MVPEPCHRVDREPPHGSKRDAVRPTPGRAAARARGRLRAGAPATLHCKQRRAPAVHRPNVPADLPRARPPPRARCRRNLTCEDPLLCRGRPWPDVAVIDGSEWHLFTQKNMTEYTLNLWELLHTVRTVVRAGPGAGAEGGRRGAGLRRGRAAAERPGGGAPRATCTLPSPLHAAPSCVGPCTRAFLPHQPHPTNPPPHSSAAAAQGHVPGVAVAAAAGREEEAGEDGAAARVDPPVRPVRPCACWRAEYSGQLREVAWAGVVLGGAPPGPKAEPLWGASRSGADTLRLLRLLLPAPAAWPWT